MQVLGTFCVLINLNNLIDALRSLDWILIAFCSNIVVVFQDNYLIIFKHDEPEPNLKMHDRIKGNLDQNCLIKEKHAVEILKGCKNWQPANFVTLLTCALTAF